MLYSRSRFSWELSELGAAKPDGARLLREAQPPSGGCVLKPRIVICRLKSVSAAFRRLCVETFSDGVFRGFVAQPPSGGCVLKPTCYYKIEYVGTAAFRRLCVETRRVLICLSVSQQPPSGGCVLKPEINLAINLKQTAAFRRLCVETRIFWPVTNCPRTAAFRRLCVETDNSSHEERSHQQPPSGGCVLKHHDINGQQSHAAAAFRRLCVET